MTPSSSAVSTSISAGRIPSVGEAHTFFEDQAACDKPARARGAGPVAERSALHCPLHQRLAGAVAAGGGQQLPGEAPAGRLRGVAEEAGRQECRLRSDGPRPDHGADRRRRRQSPRRPLRQFRGRSRITSPRSSSQRTWLRGRRGCSSASVSSAPSVTIIRSPTGNARAVLGPGRVLGFRRSSRSGRWISCCPAATMSANMN